MASTHLLPEWHPQQAILLTWPHADNCWQHKLNQIEPVYRELVSVISRTQAIVILVQDQIHQQHVSEYCVDAEQKRISFQICKTNHVWIRDYGPLSLTSNQQTQLIKFNFDGWGGKYQHQADNQVANQLCARLGQHPLLVSPLTLEGGSIDTNGAGILLTTTDCLLTHSRNPHISQSDWNQYFAEQFACQQTIWLEHGHIIGDDTDSHVDTLARFINPTTVCFSSCDATDTVQYPLLEPLAAELKDKLPTYIDCIPLPLPQPIYNQRGDRLAANYTNFLITNELVILPTFNDPADAIAIERIKACNPQREVIGVQATALLEESGVIHCASMQIAK